MMEALERTFGPLIMISSSSEMRSCSTESQWPELNRVTNVPQCKSISWSRKITNWTYISSCSKKDYEQCPNFKILKTDLMRRPRRLHRLPCWTETKQSGRRTPWQCASCPSSTRDERPCSHARQSTSCWDRQCRPWWGWHWRHSPGSSRRAPLWCRTRVGGLLFYFS